MEKDRRTGRVQQSKIILYENSIGGLRHEPGGKGRNFETDVIIAELRITGIRQSRGSEEVTETQPVRLSHRCENKGRQGGGGRIL